MKNIIAFLLITTITFFSSDAVSPSPVQAQYLWTCQASSPVAMGMWQHYNQGIAARRAIAECQVRTPYGMYCHLDGCM